MADLLRYSTISCAFCRARKVRCDRRKPRCADCEGRNVDCIYPERKKRSNKDASISEGTLETLARRLQQIEEQFSAIRGFQSTEGSVGSAQAGSSTSTQSTEEFQDVLAFFDPALIDPPAAIDATALLQDAVDSVVDLRRRTYNTCIIAGDITIPSDLAKLWISNYFAQMPEDNFLGVIDKKSMTLIPDLLDLRPHVYVDPGVMIKYYCILFYGCSVNAYYDATKSSDIRYTKAAYLTCLRAFPAWQREATGTFADLATAMCLICVAMDSFDFEMAWKMCKICCEYAQHLGLHVLDDSNNPLDNPDPHIRDANRKSFWEIIQFDMLFRLLYNKPPSISGSVWKVNLPWLALGSTSLPHGMSTTVFLISSLFTVTVASFFKTLEQSSQDMSVIKTKTHEMCQEITRLYVEYGLAQCIEGPDASFSETWMASDVALRGYTSVILMIQQAASAGMRSQASDVPETSIHACPAVLDAAAHILEVIMMLLTKRPEMVALSSTFGAYRAHIAIGYLIDHILRETDLLPYAKSIEDLAQLEHCVGKISISESDFLPLAKALKRLNNHIRKKAGDGST